MSALSTGARAGGIALLACGLFVASAVLAPVHAASAAMLTAMTELLADYHAGDFAAMENRAEALMAAAPPETGSVEGRVKRADALVVVSFGATLAEAFGPGAGAAGEARRLRAAAAGVGNAETDMALAFVEAFNAHRYGRPLTALAILDPLLEAPPPPGASAATWFALAQVLAAGARTAIGDFDAAIVLAAEARDDLGARLAEDHPFAILARLQHIEALVAAGRPQAEAEVERFLDERRPDEPAAPVLGIQVLHLAVGFVAVEEIDAMARLVFDGALAAVPPDHTLVARGLEDLAYAATVRGDYAGAMDSLVKALEIYGGSLDPEAPVIGEVTMGMAMAAANLGATGEAVALAKVALDTARAGTGPASHVTAMRMVEAATVHSIAGEPERALELLGKARLLLAEQGEKDWRLTRVFLPMQQAKALMAAGRPAEAAAMDADVLTALTGTPWAGGPAVSLVEADRALALQAAGQSAAAIEAARRALGGLLGMRDLGGGTTVGGIFTAGARSPGTSVSHTLRLTALTLIRSAWRESTRPAAP